VAVTAQDVVLCYAHKDASEACTASVFRAVSIFYSVMVTPANDTSYVVSQSLSQSEFPTGVRIPEPV
jgi:hypothetical protein